MDEKENLNNTPDGEEEKTIEEPDGENGVIELKASKIVKVNVEDEMKKSFIAYAMAVNVSRAIPDVRDGLKPVHRRILYAMSELGLYSDKPHRKCARIVGDVLGKYHPHGDRAVYEALVRLAQDFSIRCPLVDGHGNFGSVDGDPAAAQRYTEARLSKIASEMLRDIDKKTVDFYPNFDDTLEQPVVLPARFPNLLVNGSDGIAVGMATSIPPHNLGEVIDGTVALIKNPELTDEELMEYIPCPDYPTGGLVMGRAAIRQAYKTGHGGAIIRAKAEIETYNNNQRTRIVVTEIPYQVNKAKLIENIADQVKDKKIEGISDIKEESDRKGMRIVIEVKKDAEKPFMVQADEMNIRVTGTRFNVSVYPTDSAVTTTLDEGGIVISYPYAEKMGSYHMTPGQTAVYEKGRNICKVMNNAYYKEASDWKDNKLIFRNAPLGEVLTTLSRQFDISFDVRSEEISKFTYNFTCKLNNLSGIFEMMSAITPIKFNEISENVYAVKEK